MSDAATVVEALRLGAYDDDADGLKEIIRYAEWRLKIVKQASGIRKGAIMVLQNTKRTDLDGKRVRVIRVNKKSVAVVVLDDHDKETYAEYRVPDVMLGPVPA
jgi:hypothetical protein